MCTCVSSWLSSPTTLVPLYGFQVLYLGCQYWWQGQLHQPLSYYLTSFKNVSIVDRCTVSVTSTVVSPSEWQEGCLALPWGYGVWVQQEGALHCLSKNRRGVANRQQPCTAGVILWVHSASWCNCSCSLGLSGMCFLAQPHSRSGFLLSFWEEGPWVYI